MIFLIFIGVLVLLWLSVVVRIICMHPVSTIVYAVKDLYFWIKHKGYNFYEAGLLNCYCAHFGGGKTLSIVHYVTMIFNKYNNKMVWDRGRKKFVRQKIHVISNVDFKSIPYEPLASLSQVVCCAYKNKDRDYNAYDTLAVVDKLKKSVEDGDMMSEEEILQMRGDMNPDNDQITHRSRRLKKLLK